MDFLDNMNFILSADTSQFDVELPDELNESIANAFGSVMNTICEIAIYLYGDTPTEEQLEEAAQVMMLAAKKQMEPHGN